VSGVDAAGRCTYGGLRLHRGLLQPAAAAFGTRVPVASSSERRVYEEACTPCDFLISDIPWASAGDLRCPIHDATGSTCASRTPSGARWSVPSQPSIPSPHADPRLPKPSVTWWSPTPAPCSGLRSRGRRCATQRAASRTGSAGAWLEPFVLPRPADASRVHKAHHYPIHWLRRVSQTQPVHETGSTPAASLRSEGPVHADGLVESRGRLRSPARTHPPTASHKPLENRQTARRFSTTAHRPRRIPSYRQPTSTEVSKATLNRRPQPRYRRFAPTA